jgi:hypothetical protein
MLIFMTFSGIREVCGCCSTDIAFIRLISGVAWEDLTIKINNGKKSVKIFSTETSKWRKEERVLSECLPALLLLLLADTGKFSEKVLRSRHAILVELRSPL